MQERTELSTRDRDVFLKMLDSDADPNVALKKAAAEREAWLFKNKKAHASVMRGLDEAKRGEVAEPPDLEAGAKFADSIPDDDQ